MPIHRTWPLLLLATLLPAPTHAESQWFFGASIGHAVAGYEEKRRGQIAFNDDGVESSAGLELRVGPDRHRNRTYLGLEAYPQPNATLGLVTVSHDWFFIYDNLRPYLGLSGGVAVLTWEDDDPFNTGEQWNLGGESDTGVALGARAGIVVDLDEHFSFEGSAGFHWTDLKTELSHEAERYEINVRSVFSLMMGINYRF